MSGRRVEHQSPADVATHPSSKTGKKPRAKYTSKACVQCRDRKLKCSGHDPCQRCSRDGHRCLFSDDPALTAEALTQSRRRTAQMQRRRGSRYDAAASGSSLVAASAMEDRIKKMEEELRNFMDAMRRGDHRESGTADLQAQTHDSGDEDDGFRGDTAFEAPIHALNANLVSLRDQLGCQDLPSPRPSSSTSSPEASAVRSDRAAGLDVPQTSPSTDSLALGSQVSGVRDTIQFGRRRVSFPTREEYNEYLDFVFDDLNACHPCLNENEFRSRCSTIQVDGVLVPPDPCLLATNYILFACSDILRRSGPVRANSPLPGWQWYVAADELMAKRKVSGRGDLTLVQFLVYEAFYLVHVDNANAAYNVSGLACRLCFQLGLHQQRLWSADCSDYSRHMRQRIFWTVYFVDRRIALSCGRPYGIRDSDVDVDQPAWLDDKNAFPGQSLPDPDPSHSNTIYLSCVIAFARLAGEVWDQLFSGVTRQDAKDNGEKIAVLDARIKYWLETCFESSPLSSRNGLLSPRHAWQQSLVQTRMNHLRLLLRRREMVSLSYSASHAIVSGEVSIDIVRDMQKHADEIAKPSSLRFHMATSLGGAVLMLATLLCRDLSSIGLQGHRLAYTEAYRAGILMLRSLAANIHAAKRILEDMREIVRVVDTILLRQDQHGEQVIHTSHFNDSAGQGADSVQTDTAGGGLMDMVPVNMDHLFPYEPMDSTVHFTGDSNLDNFNPFSGVQQSGVTAETASNTGQGIQHMTSRTWDSWDNDYDMFLRNPGAFGVPWV